MLPINSRAVRRTLALALPALAACADEPTSPRPHAPPNATLAAAASDVVVTSTGGGKEAGTIRWAAATAPSFSRIRFDPSLEGATITVDSTIVVNGQSVTIEGPQNKGVTLSGGDRVRVLAFEEWGSVKNVTITRGFHPEKGGGIYARDGLGVENATVSFNSAPIGGGIYAHTVGLVNSTVARNTASGGGSGIYFHGGVYNGGSMTLYNSTVAQNGPAAGIEHGGLQEPNSGWVLNNSIVANNGVPLRNCADLFNATYEGTSISNDASCGGYDKVLVADPMLGVLAERGGPGATIDFARESPALNAGGPIRPAPGTPCTVHTDQRYVPRDATCDVGAFEFTDFTKVTLTIDPGATVDPATGAATVSGKMTCTRAGGRFGVVVEVQQQKGGKTPGVVTGSGVAGVACGTTTQAWRVAVAPQNGTFDSGSATARAGTYDTPQWITPASTSAPVKLARARK